MTNEPKKEDKPHKLKNLWYFVSQHSDLTTKIYALIIWKSNKDKEFRFSQKQMAKNFKVSDVAVNHSIKKLVEGRFIVKHDVTDQRGKHFMYELTKLYKNDDVEAHLFNKTLMGIKEKFNGSTENEYELNKTSIPIKENLNGDISKVNTYKEYEINPKEQLKEIKKKREKGRG